MSEDKQMKIPQKRRVTVIAAFLSICILFIITKYFSSVENSYVSYTENNYLSQFLPPKDSNKIATLEEAEAKDSSFDNRPKLLNIHEPNITITIVRSQNNKTAFKINFLNEQRVIGRNVFVQMKDINKSTENIFFIESRCTTEKINVHYKGNRGLVLNARQCCAIESTAQMNLDRNIYVFHSCSLDDNFVLHSPKFVKELFRYPNIFVVRLNTTEVFLESPLEELYKGKRLETSSYPVEHNSDLIRLVLLWKFGGTYSDLDVVTIRSLNNLKTNWAGMQDEDTIANGVINFEPEGVGHRMLQSALEYANTHYDPTNWSSNGPLLITPIILKECRVHKVIEAQNHCNGSFTVLNSEILYPIYYTGAKDFFDASLGGRILSLVKKKAYSVHIWNKMSHEIAVTVGSTQAYALLAENYCPQVYRNCGPAF